MKNKFIQFIINRNSVRHFKNKEVPMETVYKILETARWAPSGLNNQPWKFVIVRDKKIKETIGNLSHYKRIFYEAPILIPFFLDTDSVYHREKDIMSIGAAVENILLAIEALELGGVWLGEIIKEREEVEKILEVDSALELMGIVAFGYPYTKKSKERKRKELTEIIVKEYL